MQSEIIYKCTHYTACAMRDGSLVVTSNRVQKGRRLLAEDAQLWADAIRTAIDNAEAHAMCAAIMGG